MGIFDPPQVSTATLISYYFNGNPRLKKSDFHGDGGEGGWQQGQVGRLAYIRMGKGVRVVFNSSLSDIF